MIDREQISSRARAFFDELWTRGDPWEFETSGFEHPTTSLTRPGKTLSSSPPLPKNAGIEKYKRSTANEKLCGTVQLSAGVGRKIAGYFRHN
jgi:hypothetical protein